MVVLGCGVFVSQGYLMSLIPSRNMGYRTVSIPPACAEGFGLATPELQGLMLSNFSRPETGCQTEFPQEMAVLWAPSFV